MQSANAHGLTDGKVKRYSCVHRGCSNTAENENAGAYRMHQWDYPHLSSFVLELTARKLQSHLHIPFL